MAPQPVSPRLAERTSPEKAIEALSLWLNLHEGDEIPLNRLAKEAGLAWATTSKYVALIEGLQNLIPRCERTQGGIRVTEAASGMSSILDDEEMACALALLLLSRNGGQIEWTDAPMRLQTGLKELQDLDAVVQKGGNWSLTPSGWVLANNAYGQVLENLHKPRSAEYRVIVYVSDSDAQQSFSRQGRQATGTRIYRQIKGPAMEEQTATAA